MSVVLLLLIRENIRENFFEKQIVKNRRFPFSLVITRKKP